MDVPSHQLKWPVAQILNRKTTFLFKGEAVRFHASLQAAHSRSKEKIEACLLHYFPHSPLPVGGFEACEAQFLEQHATTPNPFAGAHFKTAPFHNSTSNPPHGTRHKTLPQIPCGKRDDPRGRVPAQIINSLTQGSNPLSSPPTKWTVTQTGRPVWDHD